MEKNVRSTNLRFNLDKELQHKAWDYLQTMDKQEFKSYSHVIALSLVDYFDRHYRTQDDPYLETREREEQFVHQIVAAVEKALEQTLPVFFAGCMTGLAQGMPQNRAPFDESADADAPEPDVDWDFLGE